MKDNAWYMITPEAYDAHMSHPNVMQTQALNQIIREQFLLLEPQKRGCSSAAILGITNGNGLEHAVCCGIGHVIGIDINRDFLEICKARYPQLGEKFESVQLDLTGQITEAIEVITLCDLIIANLLIEHIHLENFIKIVTGLPKHGQIVSCVIQVNPDGVIASVSGVAHVFDAVVKQVEQEDEAALTFSMAECGFSLKNRAVYELRNGKQFIRLDYIESIRE